MTGRRIVGVAVVVALVGLGPACTSGADHGSEGGGGGRPQPIDEALDLSAAGYHELPAPPTPIEWDTARVWTGDELVIWGGVAAEDDSSPGTLIDDGASLSLDDGRWTPMADSPFAEGLYHPIAAFDGTEVIIIGTECQGEVPAATDGSAPACPNGPAAAAWSPETGRWRRLPTPPIRPDGYTDEQVINGTMAATSGDGTATFSFGFRITTLRWDRTDESWTEVEGPWDDPTAPWVLADAVTDDLVGLDWTGIGGPSWSGPVPAWTLAPEAAAWTEAGRPEAGDDSVTAADGHLVSWTFKPEVGTVGRVIDLATGVVSPLESPPSGDFLMVSTVGEWIFAHPDGPMREPADHRVRRVDRDAWTPVELPDGWSPELYVGDGAFGRDPYEGTFGYWRAPDELAG